MPRRPGTKKRTGPRRPMRQYRAGEKAKWCFAVSGGRVVCNNSTNAKKPRRLVNNNVWNRRMGTKGHSSIQEQRRRANRRWVARRRAGTANPARRGTRTGANYRRRR